MKELTITDKCGVSHTFHDVVELDYVMNKTTGEYYAEVYQAEDFDSILVGLTKEQFMEAING